MPIKKNLYFKKKKKFFSWYLFLGFLFHFLLTPSIVFAAASSSFLINLGSENGEISYLFSGIHSTGYKREVANAVKNYGGLDSLRISTGAFAQFRFIFGNVGNPPNLKILAKDNIPLIPGRTYKATLAAFGDKVQLYIDEQKIFEVTDPEALSNRSGYPAFLTAHNWQSTHFFSNPSFQKLDENGNPIGPLQTNPRGSKGEKYEGIQDKSDSELGAARPIKITDDNLVAYLGRNYSFSANISVTVDQSHPASGYIGLSILGGNYNFLWSDGRECLNTCGGVNPWNNPNFADELRLADEIGAIPFLSVSARLSPSQFASFLSDLKSGVYNGKDYFSANQESGLYFEIGDEVYINDYTDNPRGYARQVNDYARILKSFNPNAKIGYTAYFDNNWWGPGCSWDRTIIPLVIENIDFVAISHYPCPQVLNVNFETPDKTCYCPTDAGSRPKKCDEVWEGPQNGGRAEKIRAYIKDILVKSGFPPDSWQVKKGEKIPIIITGTNLEGTESCYSDPKMMPSADNRDKIKFARFLGVISEKQITAVFPYMLTGSTGSRIWSLSPNSGYLQALYLFRKHFGDISIKKAVLSGQDIVFASKNKEGTKLYLIIVGRKGNNAEIEIKNGEIDFSKPVRVWTIENLTNSPNRTFSIVTNKFNYVLDSEVISLEISLTGDTEDFTPPLLEEPTPTETPGLTPFFSLSLSPGTNKIIFSSQKQVSVKNTFLSYKSGGFWDTSFINNNVFTLLANRYYFFITRQKQEATPPPLQEKTLCQNLNGSCCPGSFNNCYERLIDPWQDSTSGGCNPSGQYPGIWCCRKCK